MTSVTAVAIFAFNRPANTRRVFEAVRAARPRRLFLCLDGPRPGNEQDQIKREEIITLFQEVDWDCEVHRNYAEVNLGCRERMGSGITWVFEHVDSAILLEDDCLPCPDFFRFCEEMLERYANDPRIGMIAGHREHLLRMNVKEEYYFDRLCTIWGWATWKRAWKRFDAKMTDWPELKQSDLLTSRFRNPRHATSLEGLFDQVHAGKLGSWAAAWALSCIRNDLLCIHPRMNLISNIGCGADSTHTKNNHTPWANRPFEPLPTELRHPETVRVNEREQNKTFNCLYAPTLTHRIQNRLKRLFSTSPR